MRILLFGKAGQVGWELQRSLASLGEVLALDRHSEDHCGDLADLQGLAKTVQAYRPQVIVNAGAYTAVDKAESEPEQADLINAKAVAVMAHEAASVGALFVHYSTDYVFPGTGKRRWQEQDEVAPVNVYGASKLAGEQAIVDSGCVHLILRTSWVYAARGSNFARTMLRLASERETLGVIDDQYGAPTGADLIADVTAHLVRATCREPSLGGLYHLAAAGETTWCGYARFVIEQASALGQIFKVSAAQIQALDTQAYPTPAKRPTNSRLDISKLQAAFGLTLPAWQTGVVRMIMEITENTKR